MVELEELCLQDCHACVLGQLYGEYVSGARHIFATDAVWGYHGKEKPVQHGFIVSDNEGDRHYAYVWDMLDELWKAQIKSRREGLNMDIGKEQPAITVEPAEDPFRENKPEREPVKVPAPTKEKEAVPA